MGGYWEFMFTGKQKYYNILNFLLIGCVPLMAFLPWYLVGMIMGIVIVAWQNYMYKLEVELLTKHKGETYISVFFILSKNHKEEIVIAYNNVEEIELFHDSEQIKDTGEYQTAMVFVLSRKQEERKKLAEKLEIEDVADIEKSMAEKKEKLLKLKGADRLQLSEANKTPEAKAKAKAEKAKKLKEKKQNLLEEKTR